MTPTEEFLAQVNGTVEALVLGFGILAATHPEKEKVLDLIDRLIAQHVAESDADTESDKALKAGMRRAAQTLRNSIVVAHLANESKKSAKH